MPGYTHRHKCHHTVPELNFSPGVSYKYLPGSQQLKLDVIVTFSRHFSPLIAESYPLIAESYNAGGATVTKSKAWAPSGSGQTIHVALWVHGCCPRQNLSTQNRRVTATANRHANTGLSAFRENTPGGRHREGMKASGFLTAHVCGRGCLVLEARTALLETGLQV